MRTHDVVVIGGSLAGSACARMLRAGGFDAIAFERDRFPRDKVCGAFLSPSGVRALDELGLLHTVLDAGAAWIRFARVRGFGADFTIPFDPAGLGISRRRLDHLLAAAAPVEEKTAVTGVTREDGRFRVSFVDHDDVRCRILVDAAGKLSRFTRRVAVDEYGVQAEEEAPPQDGIDFWFYEDAYGGTISVERNLKNVCFLVRKPALRRWLGEREWRVTGPLAYRRIPGPYISVGDATGMVDPFCGDGMGHALASGILAARVIANGFDCGLDYETMRQKYEQEWSERWSGKRRLSSIIRTCVRRRYAARPVFAFAHIAPQAARAFLRRIWA
jgi:flavin-dependent dehydrogenase